MNEEIRKLIEHFGTQGATAQALGTSQGTVSGWLNGIHGMNAVTALRAERITKGAVVAVNLCPALRGLDAA